MVASAELKQLEASAGAAVAGAANPMAYGGRVAALPGTALRLSGGGDASHASHFEHGGEIEKVVVEEAGAPLPEPPPPLPKKRQSSGIAAAGTELTSTSSPDRASSFGGQKAFTLQRQASIKETEFVKDTLEHTEKVEYIDLETGDTIVVSSQQFLDPKRYRHKDKGGFLQKKAEGAVEEGVGATCDVELSKAAGSVYELHPYVEIDGKSYTWRWWVKQILLASMDDVNALRITRQLQLSVPFLTGYEAFLLDRVNVEFERYCYTKHLEGYQGLSYVLSIAFRNRNVSRAIVQALSRYDFFWHQNTQFKWNRWFDAFGQIPWIGITSFPATENFPATFNHVVSSIFRRVLGKGAWWTRVLTGRQELAVDDQFFTAQNLAAESNGFETANRNQHGSFFGRLKTNEFRLTHRLPTDESVVRTFITQPLNTMLNNGIEHVLYNLANHYRNMLFQPFGNFAHQRMEQLHPMELMRFHMPVICVALSSLRGISEWDSAVLAPFVAKLQKIEPVKNVDPVKELVAEMCDTIVDPLCGGIAPRVNALRRLLDAVDEALDMMEEEAIAVYDLAQSVITGITLGTQLITDVEWKVPSEAVLKNAVLATCLGKPCPKVDKLLVRQAMNKLAPKDKRTMIELIQKGFGDTYPTELLITRTATLLQREIRRYELDLTLRRMSKGKEVESTALSRAKLEEHHIYWFTENGCTDEEFGTSGQKSSQWVFEGKRTGRDIYKFHGLQSHDIRDVYAYEDVRFFEYVEVAEAITRAQKVFMTIELDLGRKFVYDAFMEFDFLREPLRQMLYVSQVHCSVLDDAKMNVLSRIQHSIATSEVDIEDLEPGHKYFVYNQFGKKGYVSFIPRRPYTLGDPEFDALKNKKIVRCPPQSMIVVGGGPTGLVTTLHCTENVLLSDGTMKLLESRDAFLQAGATFERAQIVRLDARWIGMLRYHCGTYFEDVWIPASGETDPHYGNTLPTQGFIEITIKDMESVMNGQVVKLASRHIIGHDTNAGAQYDVESNTLVKLGKALKVGDLILRNVDPSGKPTAKKDVEYTWKIKEIETQHGLDCSELKMGELYQLYVPKLRAVHKYQYVGCNISTKMYSFLALEKPCSDINAHAGNLPDVYPVGAKIKHHAVEALIVECVLRDHDGSYAQDTLPFAKVENEPFKLDVGETHVCEAIGKVVGPTHLATCTYEPYGVACLAGLKVSMGMHKFGTPRWTEGLIDDIRSHTDQNTRIIGDFTKTVNSTTIAELMYKFFTEDKDWEKHWRKLVLDLGLGEALQRDIFPKLSKAVMEYRDMAPYRRSHLQTRFFETGDNFYLGMEFTREYDAWKKRTVDSLVDPITGVNDKAKGRAKGALAHHIDRIWYDGCLEAIRGGDVYNPGGNTKVPRLYLIDSLTDVQLSTLDVRESFRVSADPANRWELLIKPTTKLGAEYVVRDVEGYITTMRPTTMVLRGGNLTRNPGGNQESKVSLATFPVSHYVNHRTMRLSNSDHGYVFAFLGDEQATPHFMRYSGLTGACINSMLFNNFIGDAIHGDEFVDRFRRYSAETNWSNGEVVQRGTGANYGEDGFLRPGAPYLEWVRYLMSKVCEYRETQQDLTKILSRDWKIKVAAAMVPRGLEFNEDFLGALRSKFFMAVFDAFVKAVEKDKKLAAVSGGMAFGELLKTQKAAMGDMAMSDAYWEKYLAGLSAAIPPEAAKRIETEHVFIAKYVVGMLAQVIEYAQGAHLRNERISSGLENQPKSVDSLIDDFAVEGQTFSNSLAATTSYGALALAFGALANTGTGNGVAVPSIILSSFSPIIAFNTITNSSRYKNRNEDYRVKFMDERYVPVLKGIYNAMSAADQAKLPLEKNPYFRLLEVAKNKFVGNVKYYDHAAPKDFLDAYSAMVGALMDPAATKAFMKRILTEFIVDDKKYYAVSSYLQQDLVELYGVCEEMVHAHEHRPELSAEASERVAALFTRMDLVAPRFETSLQRGSILYGFAKVRKLKHQTIATMLQFLWTKIYPSFLCCGSPATVEAAAAASARGGCLKPMVVENKEIVGMFDAAIKAGVPAPYLRREKMDVESCYFAAKESQVMSYIFLTSSITMVTFLVFIVAQICRAATSDQWARTLVDVATAMSASNQPFTALLSTAHLLRLLTLLGSVGCTVASKVGQVEPAFKSRLRHIYCISIIAFFANLIRMTASIGAAVSIPWNLASSLADNQDGALNRDYPIYIAIASGSAHVLAVFLLLFIEYTIRWTLDTQLGAYVGGVFVDELKAEYADLTLPKRSIDPPYCHERACWEYVARMFLHKYRFDVVFQANRFGSIFHTIQNAWQKPQTQDETRTYAQFLTSGIFLSGQVTEDPHGKGPLTAEYSNTAHLAGPSTPAEVTNVTLKTSTLAKKLKIAANVIAKQTRITSVVSNLARDSVNNRHTASRTSKTSGSFVSAVLASKRLQTGAKLHSIAFKGGSLDTTYVASQRSSSFGAASRTSFSRRSETDLASVSEIFEEGPEEGAE